MSSTRDSNRRATICSDAPGDDRRAPSNDTDVVSVPFTPTELVGESVVVTAVESTAVDVTAVDVTVVDVTAVDVTTVDVTVVGIEVDVAVGAGVVVFDEAGPAVDDDTEAVSVPPPQAENARAKATDARRDAAGDTIRGRAISRIGTP